MVFSALAFSLTLLLFCLSFTNQDFLTQHVEGGSLLTPPNQMSNRWASLFSPEGLLEFQSSFIPSFSLSFFLSVCSLISASCLFPTAFFNDLFKQCAQVERQFLVEGFGWHIPPSLMVKTSACVPPEPPLDLRRCCGHLSSVNHPEGSMNEPPGENRTEIGQAERREERRK